MIKISSKQQKILAILLGKADLSSSIIHKEIINRGESLSLVTTKRTLSEMVRADLLLVDGSGPATIYNISAPGRVHAEVDANAYCATEPDKRTGQARFNFDFFAELPNDIFASEELATLQSATSEYHRRTIDISETIQKKELERLVIELSWKSSKIVWAHSCAPLSYRSMEEKDYRAFVWSGLNRRFC